MTPELTTLLAILGTGVLLVAAGVYWWISRTPTVERHDEALPLFGGLASGERASTATVPPAAPSAPMAARPVPPASVSTPSVASMSAPVERAAEAPPRPRPVVREFVTSSAPPPSKAPLIERPIEAQIAPPPSTPVPGPSAAVMSDEGVPGSMVEGHALRYSVPADGTLQFLPGRLEINTGLDTGREIRFVRVDGPNGIEVTFGRSEGALYRHVQLRDKTVSRAHARMHFEDGTWYLENRSQTNPVVHNGVEMPATISRPLIDGDRIEMGEVIFTFRER